MLRISEHAQRTDTGRQRPHNEDSFVVRRPLFAVADGMGGAQAGEVASRMAVEVLQQGLGDGAGSVAERLTEQVLEANHRIHDRARRDRRSAGMGTTLTAAYVDVDHLVVVHVGDSRLYRLREGQLERLTRDHSLVEELVRQGRLTPEQALEHPQRSIITRALGPEPEVAVDAEVLDVRDGDLYLVCSDGLTAMLSEPHVGEILVEVAAGAAAGDAPAAFQAGVDRLVDEANAAGGRDNITVLLFRVAVEDGVGGAGSAPGGAVAGLDDATAELPRVEQTTTVMPTVDPAAAGDAQHTAVMPVVGAASSAGGPEGAGPRDPRPAKKRKKRRFLRTGPAVVLFLVACIFIGGYFASQTVYFVGSDRGLVTVFRGVPIDLPAGLRLYKANYFSSVPVDEVPRTVRGPLLDHQLRSLEDANDLVAKLERNEVVRP